MNTYEINGQNIVVLHASAVTSGYGHKKITVELMEESSGRTGTFTATTNYMTGYDAANELEGQDKYEALFELIDSKIQDEVYAWL